MIPLALRLKSLNHNVIIASGDELLSFFTKEIPGINCIDFPGFRMKYSENLPQYFVILFRIPFLFYHIIREHFRVKKILREYSIDIIISDSRPGLWNKSIKSVFVFHFPRPPVPKQLRFLEKPGIALARFFITKYSLCFIPDLPGNVNISGRLSHELSLPSNVRYIGILSRFSAFNNLRISPEEKPYFTVILSGPEPQRGILKNRLSDILRATGKPTVILEGNPGKELQKRKQDNIIFISHPSSEEMGNLIQNSEVIVARSGYTTIMELISLNKSAMIIPTPGQTEQEYLAGYMAQTGWFSSCSQDKLKTGFEICAPQPKWPAGITAESEKLLNTALSELLE
jgi:hypothetical protein